METAMNVAAFQFQLIYYGHKLLLANMDVQILSAKFYSAVRCCFSHGSYRKSRATVHDSYSRTHPRRKAGTVNRICKFAPWRIHREAVQFHRAVYWRLQTIPTRFEIQIRGISNVILGEIVEDIFDISTTVQIGTQTKHSTSAPFLRLKCLAANSSHVCEDFRLGKASERSSPTSRLHSYVQQLD